VLLPVHIIVSLGAIQELPLQESKPWKFFNYASWVGFLEQSSPEIYI
jgi:hypothetical protein